MQTHKAKRVEITIEAVMERRLATALEEVGVTGFTILPVLGGSGRSGNWSREGQVSRASGMINVVCIIRPERLAPLLDAVGGILERHIGVISVTDCEVLRAERF
ncbi:transcriptional regulator [Rhodobacteraceae bacterium 2376]|uniref:Nitrogen regulatory protein P-II n=1 Tax=Rhabdonatronobacter sediminivivens TaxID=2743469 RepID=A0A7Z0I2R6_9RHOB|nr:transcriptional regulator [Rhabdonatronobacter sediminivivens]NYS26907.1 transcriptional regulator [Rhabdonatronobacter sediminivivens]